MSATAEAFGHCSNIPRALAAQAHAEAPIGKLTEKSSYFDIVDGKSIIH